MARNVVAMISARGAVAAAGLVSLPVVYAHLGADEFGVWAVLTGTAAIVALADLGLGSAIIRQVAASVEDVHPSPETLRRTRSTLGIGLVWGVALAGLGTAVLMGVWPWLVTLLHFGRAAPAARWAALCLMGGLLADGIAVPWRGALEGTQRYEALARVNGATALLGSALAVLAMTAGGGLVALAATVAATGAIRAAATVGLARRHEPSLSPSFAGIRPGDVRRVGGYGLRVQLTSVSGAVNLELDRFILTAFFGPAVAGGFELGARVVNLFRLLPVFALVAAFPMAVTRTAERGSEWLDRFNVTATKYLTAIAATGAAVLVACAGPLVRLWLGQTNHAATVCISILAPAYVLNLAAGTTGILSRVEDRPGMETGYAVLTMLLNLALTWPLLHLLGPKGVPSATAVAIVVGTGYFLVRYHRATHRSLAGLAAAIWPSLLAAVTAALSGLLVRSLLPAGAGRLGAAFLVAATGSVVLAVAVGLLVATGFVRGSEIAGLGRTLRPGAVPMVAAGGSDA